ncbi:MAG: GGDEF domain-containing phosphodiesterase [Gammaproteobacteria bacterium]|nr:GGDEF domain-containing phosphodiesterase [Gammaproteobacteria bacterium]
MSDAATAPAICRAQCLSALDRFVAAARAEQSHLGMLLVDIGGLARINHSHGYALGDHVLLTSQRELLALSKLPDTVFRVGSHSFAFLLPQLGNPALIALAINKVNSQLRASLSSATGGLKVDIHVGVAVNHEGRAQTLEMLSSAEASVRQVRAGGDHGLEQLLQHVEDETKDDQLEQHFITALRENDFGLAYQPKVNLLTGNIESVEALLRWRTNSGETVSPEKVVALAAVAGRSFELTKWIVHQAFRQLKEWQAVTDIGVAVNVQAELVSSPDVVSLLTDARAIWGVDPQRVTVEITENAIIEDKQAGFSNLTKLRDAGMRLSIDDFGTGYSSLSYFKHIPASELKIDRSFIQSFLEEPREFELVKIMIQIGREFGMSVVAEGIEDESAFRTLRELGCDYGQGFYFAKPMKADALEHWLLAWEGLPQ